MFKQLIVLFLLANLSLAQNKEGEPFIIGKKYTMTSKVLNEERTYWVNLPTSYNDPNFSPQKYPVMYVLDGKSVFFPLVGVVNFMSGRESVNFQIPEMIVVGIDTENRIHDLTPNPTTKGIDGTEPTTEAGKLMFKGSGGGELFLEFLTKELFPSIETNYRTVPYRVYVGHSLGGLTSTYTLLHHAGIFDSYLAIDPSLWWDASKYPNEAHKVLQNYETKKIQRYYVTVIDSMYAPGQSYHLNAIHKMSNQLAKYAPENLQWKLQVIPKTDHSSIPLLSWYEGLQFIFEGYDMNHYSLMQNPDLIEKQFDELAKKIGLRMSPPETIFEILAHYLTAPNRFPDAQKSLKVINMGLKYHPESSNLHDKLGAAYLLNKNIPKAIESYQKALKLNPANEIAKKRIEDLTKQTKN
ncbi:alpha/beta hydrolase-fold protein [Runella sp.]|jgi:hypothetical protein|uniref:alpha/beta hydrolase-fold protein n=1 Tax=Runella sp. TaxID=1960881 RepID=UPI002632C85E|nr:alpha/beta hydrolase-fold protein [Runella sp.]